MLTRYENVLYYSDCLYSSSLMQHEVESEELVRVLSTNLACLYTETHTLRPNLLSLSVPNSRPQQHCESQQTNF